MNSFLLGGIVGVGLALLNFFSSTLFSSKTIRVTKLTSVVWALGGFVARLMILSLLFYGLSKVKGIHFQTTLVIFAFSFTFCLILKITQFYQELKFFKQKTTQL